jgi:hypothetical protein
MILTKHTFKVATGEEYGAGSVSTGNTRFFPHMKGGTGYLDEIAHSAKTGLLGSAVHTTISGTQSTGCIHKTTSVIQ